MVEGLGLGLSWQSAWLECTKAWVPSLTYHTAEHESTCLSFQHMGGGSKCHKFRAVFGYVASLSYKRPCFKQNKTENQTKASAH